MLKKIRGVSYFASALLLSLSWLFIIPHKALAAPGTNWTGLGDGTTWNDASNWDAGVPGNGYIVNFDNSSNILAEQLNNDIGGLTLSAINFSGSSSNGWIISGNAINLSGGITDSTNATDDIDMPVTLTQPQTLDAGTAGANLFFTQSLNFGSNNLGLTGLVDFWPAVPIVGSGPITTNGVGVFSPLIDGDTSLLTSTIHVVTGLLVGSSFGSGAITIDNGASLSPEVQGSTTLTLNNNIDVTGVGDTYFNPPNPNTYGAVSVYQLGNPNINPKLTLAGTVTLHSNSRFGSENIGGIIKLTGPLSGAFTLGTVPQSGAQLVISSSGNTSNTVNGTKLVAWQIHNISNNHSSTIVNAAPGQDWTIDGVRGATDVRDGGLLEGKGKVGRLVVHARGTVSPGHSPGCLSTGNLDIKLSGTYKAQINGGTVCSGYDRLKVSGSVKIRTGGRLVLSVGNSFHPAHGSKYRIISNNGTDAVSGHFKSKPEGQHFTIGNFGFKITYKGGTGNDVVLTRL